MINRRFSLKKKLGQGRSSVYLCEDSEQYGKFFALKILSADSTGEEKEIFQSEFQTIQKLDHPNIIQAYERGTVVEVSENESISIGSKYLLMEFVESKELHFYSIENETVLEEIISQICSVLFYLHQSNYIYYDLKLENLLVSEKDGKPFIKLIDLGFARKKTEETFEAAGTAEYLAPELLKKEQHDHRVDLYSLGILLYRLIYKEFPFSSSDQLEIYKEQIGSDFNFPKTNFSPKLIEILKKLLAKNPEERYFNSLQVLYDLNMQINDSIYQNWMPIKVFSDRVDILNIVNRYVANSSSGEVIVIRGFENSGKTTVLNEIYSRYDNCVIVSNDRTKSGFQLIKFFLNNLIFSETVYSKLTSETLNLADKIFTDASSHLLNDLRLLVNQLSQQSKFIILFDDFNLYDNLTLEIFKEIFPIFQVNGCTIILAERSDLDYVTGFINNLVELNLPSFTTIQTEELIEKTYAKFYPIKEVTQLVMHHADFLPGNIIEFLKDIVLLKIIRFEYDGIKVKSGSDSDAVLGNLYNEIYQMRRNSLTKDELKIAELLSIFEILPDRNQLTKLANLSVEEFSSILEELQRKHVLLSQAQSSFNFSSDAIKNFVYGLITDRKTLHKNIAESIKRNFPKFSRVELARQYEISGDHDESYSLLMNEADEAEKIFALKYKQDILEKLLKLPVKDNKIENAKVSLCLLYDRLNNYKAAFQLADELLTLKLEKAEAIELNIIKGNSLIKLGEAEKGIEELKSILPSIDDQNKIVKVMLDIAWAELELNNYDRAGEIGNKVKDDPKAIPDFKGDSYNLLGLIDLYQKDDLRSALTNFEKCLTEYTKANIINRIAAIEINLGNIFNMLGEYDKVESYWNKSLETSTRLGNLYYQAQVLMNFGIYHFNKQSFEPSISNYKRAALIFNTIGDEPGYGRSQINLGEVLLFTCEYNEAIESLKNASEVFHKIQNYAEESEALFLLGKIYSRTGDDYNFKKNYDELDNLVKENNLPDRVKIHMEFLNQLNKFEQNNKLETEQLRKIAKEYLISEERVNFIEVSNIMIEYFLREGQSKNAFDELSQKKYIEICSSNIYYNIDRLYLTGKTALLSPDLYPESGIYYFNDAYKLLDDLIVNETMCKIMIELSKYYFDRGNVLKAQEFASYAISGINFLADRLPDERTKDNYLNSSYRKEALKNLTEIVNS